MIALYLTGSRIMSCQLRVGCSGNSRYRRRDADYVIRKIRIDVFCVDQYRCIFFGTAVRKKRWYRETVALCTYV